jgi:short-subunit dehydrogenase
MTIKNSVIIVTGASMGIGAATAKELAKRGAKVVLAARSKDKIDALAKELKGSFEIVTDMSDTSSIKRMVVRAMEKYGRIDALVNNAARGMYGGVENIDPDDYRKIFELNVVGPLVAMQEVIPIMRKQGGGMILNISSMVSKNYFPYLGGYASTKYALNALSLTARAELKKDNITVSLMLPGMTDTDFGKNAVKLDAVGKMMEPRQREGGPKPDSAEHIATRIVIALESKEPETYAN